MHARCANILYFYISLYLSRNIIPTSNLLSSYLYSIFFFVVALFYVTVLITPQGILIFHLFFFCLFLMSAVVYTAAVKAMKSVH